MIKSNLKILIFFLSFLFMQFLYADFSGKCVGVSDGDTISVMNEGKAVKIRLEGVDCPESHQDYGAKAKEFTSIMVFGKEVTVKEKNKDQYGRILATVFIGEKNLNLELVKAGLAWHYKAYSKDKELASAEEKAREVKDGLWSMINLIPPWEFRKRKKINGKVTEPLNLF